MIAPSSAAAILVLGGGLGLLAGNPHVSTGRAAQTTVTKTRIRALDPLSQLAAQADAAIEKKDYPAALQALNRYLAARPDDATAHFQLGYVYTALERWPDAQAEYQKAIQLDPKMAAAYLNLGLVFLNHDPAAAIAPLTKAGELQPNEARPKYLLGVALDRTSKTAEAAAQYQAAERLGENTFDLHYSLATDLLALSRPADAEAEFRRALALRPNESATHAGLAESLLAQNKPDDAVAEFQTYLKAKPKDREVRLRLASVLLDNRKYEQALADLDGIDASGPGGARVFRLRAEACLGQKQYGAAAKNLQNASELAPSDPDLRARLGHVYLEMRKFPLAARELAEALRLNPALTDALSDLRAADYLGGDYAAALAVQELLEKRVPPTAMSWFIRATCYDHLGRKEDAVAAYRKFLALDHGAHDREDFQAGERAHTLARELGKEKE